MLQSYLAWYQLIISSDPTSCIAFGWKLDNPDPGKGPPIPKGVDGSWPWHINIFYTYIYKYIFIQIMYVHIWFQFKSSNSRLGNVTHKGKRSPSNHTARSQFLNAVFLCFCVRSGVDVFVAECSPSLDAQSATHGLLLRILYTCRNLW